MKLKKKENADGRTRTDTLLLGVDFESTASTNSTTSAISLANLTKHHY